MARKKEKIDSFVLAVANPKLSNLSRNHLGNRSGQMLVWSSRQPAARSRENLRECSICGAPYGYLMNEAHRKKINGRLDR